MATRCDASVLDDMSWRFDASVPNHVMYTLMLQATPQAAAPPLGSSMPQALSMHTSFEQSVPQLGSSSHTSDVTTPLSMLMMMLRKPTK